MTTQENQQTSEPQNSGQDAASVKRDTITGLFSSQEIRKVGTGTTTKKTIQKAFWYCVEMPDGKIEVQPVNPNYIPSGPKRQIEREEFFKSFNPEPEFYVSNVFPKMRELSKTIARGERYRSNGELFSAEMEFNNVLNVDEENVRANFGLGITYLERGEDARAEDILGRIVKLDAAFEGEHKHLFNEFGISLRKNRMYGQAVEYYKRSLELSGPDANLYYNIARACLESKDVNSTIEYLIKALETNPALEEATRFLMWLVSKNMVPEDKKMTVLQALKAAKEAVASGGGTSPAEVASMTADTEPDIDGQG